MKNSIFTLFVLSVFIFSCSNEEAIETNDFNVDSNRNYLTNVIQTLSQSQDFRDMVTSNNLQRNSEGNGVMILQDGYNLSYFAIDGGNAYLLGGSGTIDLMPNGRARFRIHTNNPSAAVLDLTTYTTLYSSDCMEGPLGTFNYNYISDYIVEVFEPVPGVVFTFYIPTGENASAESRNGHCNISNAQPIMDENFEITGCTDATDYKVLRLGPSGMSLE